jgi:type II secretory pathway component PulJ
MIEMLVSLSLFAMIAALASQSLLSVIDGLARTRHERSGKTGDLRVQALLDRAVRSEVPSPASSSLPRRLTVGERDNTSALVWMDSADNEHAVTLGDRDIYLRRETDDTEHRVLSLILPDGEEETVIAASGSRTTAPRNCRYDAITQRCAETIR